MPKYSFRTKNSDEFINSINAGSIIHATFFFAEMKKLDIETFNKLYEVVER